MEIWRIIIGVIIIGILMYIAKNLIKFEKILNLNKNKKIYDIEPEISKLLNLIKSMIYILAFVGFIAMILNYTM
ncbi:MAG: hypothetical protein A2Y23_13940 [Clostridiales bacterium GWB2_37_7]|nr:MAG: hypothetical protein A2Y23_13940 [Clostridiales bacterium GWB2_37_7]